MWDTMTVLEVTDTLKVPLDEYRADFEDRKKALADKEQEIKERKELNRLLNKYKSNN